MKLQVLIADADPDFQRTMTQALSREGDMEAAGVSSDGLETLSLIQTARPDVVLLDLIQQRLAAVVAECAKLGAAYFIPKPCDTAALMQCLRQCAKAGRKSPAAAAAPNAPAPVPAHLESAVTDVLHEIGVPAHVKGYQYLREGILFTIRDADSTAGITKVLYPTVAKKFSSTPSCVERSMRHAIDIAWNRGDEDVQEKIFCGAFSGSTGRPTNGEFIATIAELVLQQISK